MMVTGDTDQDNCDDDGDHIGVDDDDKDEKEVAVHNKGTLLPFLWVPTIAPASNHQIQKVRQTLKSLYFERWTEHLLN